jgi:hypothetical protein
MRFGINPFFEIDAEFRGAFRNIKGQFTHFLSGLQFANRTCYQNLIHMGHNFFVPAWLSYYIVFKKYGNLKSNFLYCIRIAYPY